MHRRIINKNLSSWVSCQVPPCDKNFSKHFPVLLLACSPRTCSPPIHLSPVSAPDLQSRTALYRVSSPTCRLLPRCNDGTLFPRLGEQGGSAHRHRPTSRLATLGRLDSKLAFHSITREQGVGWHLAISGQSDRTI
jgi:hypothetical protein